MQTKEEVQAEYSKNLFEIGRESYTLSLMRIELEKQEYKVEKLLKATEVLAQRYERLAKPDGASSAQAVSLEAQDANEASNE